MELPEPACRGKYGVVEEELTLTPHHTPSQSFDFIVWEKAYLDSIPAAGAGSSCSSSSSSSIQYTHDDGREVAAPGRQNASNSGRIECTDLKPSKGRPPTKGGPAEASIRDDDSEERRVPTSSDTDAPLMACRTDADLPSSFFVCTPRIRYEGGGATSCSCVTEYAPHRSSAGGLTSLEEAVRNYAEGRTRRNAPPSPGTYSKRHGMMFKASAHSSQYVSAAQDHNSSSKYVKASVNNEAALLKRSLSQPGGDSKGWMRPTGLHAGGYDMKSSTHATILKPTSKHKRPAHPVEFYHDQCNAEQPQDGAKLSCFPISLIGSSPGRQKHGRSSTLDDREISDIVGKQYNTNRVDVHNRDKLMFSTYKPTLYIHQQQDKLPPTTWTDFIGMPVGAASRGGRCALATTMQQHTAGYCRSSFSDISSLSSNDHHAASAVLSKLKLWGLNHKIRALCRKFCSSCPNFSPS